MLNPGKKILNETKNHNPPVQDKWSVPYMMCYGALESNIDQNRMTAVFVTHIIATGIEND